MNLLFSSSHVVIGKVQLFELYKNKGFEDLIIGLHLLEHFFC
jgi:hypothetical protein